MIEFVSLGLRNLQYYRRVLSGVPSGSGGYVGGREHRMDDDDDDVNDDDFDVRNLLRQRWRIGFCAVG